MKLRFLIAFCVVLTSIFVLYAASIYPVWHFYRIPVLREIIISLSNPKNIEELKIITLDKNEIPIWTFAVIGHSRSGEEAIVSPSLKKAISYSINNRVDIIFLAGDILIGYNSNFRRYKKDVDALANYFDSLKIPIYVAPGNHDHSTEEQKEYFEKNFNKSYMHIQRDKVDFLILHTSAWHKEKIKRRSFQINADSKSERGYHVLPIPGNSDKYKPLPFDQHNLLLEIINNKIIGQPRSGDNFDIPKFLGIIMHHRQWIIEKGDWLRRWHPYLRNQNAFVFCGDYIEKTEYKVLDCVHYINTALNSNDKSFVIGTFFQGDGILFTEVNINGESKPIIFEEIY